MFGFGRELRRWFQGSRDPDAAGLTGGDPALLELLDLKLLAEEATTAQTLVSRATGQDRARRRLAAAAAWREFARRTGDEAALRRAAANAEKAANELPRGQRARDFAAARCEQGLAALAGADLFSDEGLAAAAAFAFQEAERAAPGGLCGARARLGRLMADIRCVAAACDAETAQDLAGRFAALVGELAAAARRDPAVRLECARARIERAAFLVEVGERLGDPALLRLAAEGLRPAGAALDPAYEPVTFARLAVVQGQARAALGVLEADLSTIADAVSGLAAAAGQISRAHSPLDWARAQIALAGALELIGDAGDSAPAYDQALGCYDLALGAIGDRVNLPARAAAAHARVACLVRRAELTADLAGLDEAERGLRTEIAIADPVKDPVAWAVRQLSFAEIRSARAAILGPRAESAAGAGLALAAAVDVFAEHGLRSMVDAANRELERLRMRATLA